MILEFERLDEVDCSVLFGDWLGWSLRSVAKHLLHSIPEWMVLEEGEEQFAFSEF